MPHHAGCHIHTATAKRINDGLKPEGHIEMTVEYSTLEDALQFYIRKIGIVREDRQKYFPVPNQQMDIFGNLE